MNMVPRRTRPQARRRAGQILAAALPILAGIDVMCGTRAAQAQIGTDSSLGKPGAPLVGPNFLIPSSLGQTRGGNLFHSFGQFNLATGESATFAGPASINNVIARVTGGTPSNIDGKLSCTIPNANVYLINPAGVVFGPNAQLDVSGSFAVTTAPILRFADGGTFNAQTPADSVLSSAAPVAFGFLTPDAAPVTVQGGLAVLPGKTLSIVAGPVSIAGGGLQANGGRVNVVGVAAAGDVKVDPSAIDSPLDVAGIAHFADITLNGGAIINADAGVGGGGRVVLRGGKLVIDDSSVIAARTPGGTASLGVSMTADAVIITHDGFITTESFPNATGQAGPVDITSTDLTIRDGGSISTSTFGLGNAGGVKVNVSGAMILDQGMSQHFTGISSKSKSPDSGGDAGSITLNAGSLQMLNGAEVSSSTFGLGNAGGVTVNVSGAVILDNGAAQATGINSNSYSSDRGGNAGNLTLNAGSLQVLNGAQITSSTLGQGNGGDVRVSVTGLASLSGADGAGNPSGLFAVSQSSGAGGDAGSVTLNAGSLQISNFAQVTSSTAGLGNAGGVTINVVGAVTLDNSAFVASQSSSPEGGGNAGIVRLNAGSLQVLNGSEVSSSTSGLGTAGGVIIDVSGAVTLDPGPSGFFTGIDSQSLSESTDRAGNAGSVTLKAGSFQVLNGAEVSSSTFGVGNAGGVIVNVSGAVILDKGASPYFTGITSESNSIDKGANAGSITVNAGSLQVLNGARVSSETVGLGNGGDVKVSVTGLALLSGTDASANPSGLFATSKSSAAGGDAGSVMLNAGSLQLTSGAQFSSSTVGLGKGGDVNVNVTGLATLSGTDASGKSSGLFANSQSMGAGGDAGIVSLIAGSVQLGGGAAVSTSTNGAGNAGTVQVQAQSLMVASGSLIHSDTFGLGHAGGVVVNVSGAVTLDSGGSSNLTGISSNSVPTGQGGDAGSVMLNADSIAVRGNMARIGALTSGAGAGGNVVVNAMDIVLSDRGQFVASAGGAGNGGNIQVKGTTLRMSGGSAINASSDGAGLAGTVQIESRIIHLTSHALIASGSTGTGNGGSITLDARSRILIDGNAGVGTQSAISNGGDIELNARESITMLDARVFANAGGNAGTVTFSTGGTLNTVNSSITTKADHNGGNIILSPRLALFNDTLISASAGNNGGDIRIQPEALLASQATLITATGKTGISGQIEVTPPDQAIASSLARLPASLYTTDLTLQPQCGQMTGMMNVSSFVVSGRGGVPLAPGTWQVDFNVRGLADPSEAATTKPARTKP